MELANPIPFDEGSFMDGKHADAWAKVAEDLHRGYHVANALRMVAFKKQAQAAAKLEYYARDWNTENWWLDVPKFAYFYWANRLGVQCWEDPQFRREFARDNPECVRRNITGNTVITKPQPKWDVQRAFAVASNPEAGRLLELAAAKAA